MSDARRMVYPVTLAQKIKHFPYKFHWKHSMKVRCLLFSIPVCYFAFLYLEKLSYAPSNVAKYEEYLRKEKEEVEKHMHHLEGYYEDRHKH